LTEHVAVHEFFDDGVIDYSSISYIIVVFSGEFGG
jgi:hypothetical protein